MSRLQLILELLLRLVLVPLLHLLLDHDQLLLFLEPLLPRVLERLLLSEYFLGKVSFAFLLQLPCMIFNKFLSVKLLV